ncbi:Hypothetical_protein [Hexamita inflata]|uniref:Hypothetical_protein n=1 Tax=Hexamita inflata TaxID=28002 RepID=A0AA86QQB4_9EUKA|nr:Hypothetical protein HINF_LOCUS13677 [Hexamita inflata]CAI9962625.1 Hypothetical protein HINF_LOCUS50270 [Hexamita inflata]
MQAIKYFSYTEPNFEHLFFNNHNKTNDTQLSLQSDSEHQTRTNLESKQRQRTESDILDTTLECSRAYSATPLQKPAQQESVAGTLPKAKTMAFEFELLYAIRLYFRDQRFESLREALIYHKQYHATTNKKVHLNFKQLGQSCGISESQARNAFDTAKQQHLDSLTTETKNRVTERIDQLWAQVGSEVEFAARKQLVLEQVEKEFQLSAQHNLNHKAVTNMLYYTVNKLKAAK